MAKKNKNKSARATEESTQLNSEASSQSLDAAAVAAAAADKTVAPAPSQDAQEDLSAQLQAAKAEIAQLKDKLAQRDAEIAALKSSKPLARSEEVDQLQERLKQLRKEQQDADAAKEAAWRQLKSVIGEISKMAGPVAPGSAA